MKSLFRFICNTLVVSKIYFFIEIIFVFFFLLPVRHWMLVSVFCLLFPPLMVSNDQEPPTLPVLRCPKGDLTLPLGGFKSGSVYVLFFFLKGLHQSSIIRWKELIKTISSTGKENHALCCVLCARLFPPFVIT